MTNSAKATGTCRSASEKDELLRPAAQDLVNCIIPNVKMGIISWVQLKYRKYSLAFRLSFLGYLMECFFRMDIWVRKDNISMLDVGIKIFEGLAFVISRLIYAITCEMV